MSKETFKVELTIDEIEEIFYHYLNADKNEQSRTIRSIINKLNKIVSKKVTG